MARTLFLAAFLAFNASHSNAFVVDAPAARRTSSSAMNLLPTQASELVAASSTVYRELHSEFDAQIETTVPKAPTSSAARNFVSRVFSLPSAMIKKHPYPAAEGLDDVVLFPIVGCRLVRDAPDHFRALPAIVSNPSCRLPNRKEQEYGSFAPKKQA